MTVNVWLMLLIHMVRCIQHLKCWC